MCFSMKKDHTGPGHQCKYTFAGPHVIDKYKSPHLYTLQFSQHLKLYHQILIV